MWRYALIAVLTLAIAAEASEATQTSVGNVVVPYSDSDQDVALQATVAPVAGTINEGTVTITVANGFDDMGIPFAVGTPITVAVANGIASGTYVLPGGTNISGYQLLATFNGTPNFDYSVGNGVLSVTAQATTTTVDSVTTPFNASGHDVILNATVNTSSGAINTSSVNFRIKRGSEVLWVSSLIPVAAGKASATYSVPAGMAVGVYTLTATFVGNEVLASSVGTGTFTVQSTGQTAVTTTLTSNVRIEYSVDDQTATLSATVTSQAGAVNAGTLEFTIKDGNTVIGMPVIANVAAGAATGQYVIPHETPIKTYSIEAAFSGTSAFDGSLGTATLTIAPPPSLTSTQVDNPGVDFSSADQPVQLHASVMSGVTVNEGSVTFQVKDGATQIGGTLNANVVAGSADAQFTVPGATPAKAYTIEVAYSGTLNFTSSNSTGVLDVRIVKSSTTTATENVQTDFSDNVQNVILQAHVTSPGQTVNQETVTFRVKDGVTLVGVATVAIVNSGEASASYTLPASLPAKNYTIEATYNGGANFNSSSATAVLSVLSENGDNPTVTVLTNAQVNFNANSQPVSFHATVTSPSSTVNEGIVTFTVRDGAAVIGFPVTASVTANSSTGNFSVPGGLAAKLYTLSAEYSGGINFNPSSATGDFTVNPAGGGKSATLTGVQNAIISSKPTNQNVPFQASVSSIGGTVNEGFLSFKVMNGAAQIGTTLAVAVANGAAGGNFLLPGGTPAGDYTIEAAYGGGTHFEASSATGTLTVQPQGSTSPTTTLVTTVLIIVSSADQFANLEATISSTGGTPNEGTVVFTVKDGGSTIGNPITVNIGNGSASGTYTIPANTPVKNYIIRAAYSGGPTFDSSNGAGTLSIVAPPANQPPTFVSGPTATPNAPFVGQTVSFTLTSSDPENEAVTASWDFGDSGTASGSTTTHVFTTVGTYAVVAKLLDARNASASATVTVVVGDPIYGDGPDTDGDGFSDSFETVCGSNPNLATSTPFGTAQAVEPLLLTLKSLAIKLDFVKPAADSVTVTGILPTPNNFNFTNKRVIVDIGGFVTPFTLDSKGKSTPKSTKAFAIAKPKDGIAAFSCKMSKIDLDAFLVDEGLTPTATKDKRVTVRVTVLFNNAGYQKNQVLIFNQSKGAKGATKAPK